METLTKSKIFIWWVLFFLGGVSLVSFCYPKKISSIFLGIIFIFSLILICVFWDKKRIVFGGLGFWFFLIGIIIFNQSVSEIQKFNQEKEFSGEVRIVREPENKNEKKRIVAESEDNFRIFIFENQYSNYSYGQILKLDCQLEIPENQKDSRFDYRMYLAKDKIFYLCQKPKIEIISQGQGKFLYATLIKIKNKLGEKIEKSLPYPESGLLFGLLLGGDSKVSKNLKEDFSRTGLSHIVAVSGYNVAIIADYLMVVGIFFGLWRQQAFWLAILGITLFVLLIGFPSSAVRAGVMGGLLLLAMKEGRIANSKNAILFSAAVMLAFNPLLLRYDVGFQLSFLATLGIVYFYPILDEYLIKKQKHWNFVGELLGLTLAAQIFVFPIIFYNFESLSLVSPLANLLILPIIPLTMLFGFFLIVFGLVFPPLATVFSWLAFLPLKYETLIIRWLSGFQWASVKVSFSFWGIIIWYLVLSVFFFIINKKTKWLKEK